jgi:hypothetical protein
MIRTMWARWFARAAFASPTRSRRSLRVESLEAREVPAAFHPTYIVRPSGAGGLNPFASSGPVGLTPILIRHAYGFDKISFNGVAGDGSGTTIAIVDAYDDPRIASDLHNFDVAFGLPDPVFTKVNQSGGSTMPAADAGWSGEIALDVEWSHAIAPKANILLVEANSATYNDLLSAVRYAASVSGVVAVSMSWGGGEFSTETSFDSSFRTPTGHAGVAFFASSGDAGAPASYPATSPNVIAAGGTHLSIDGAGNWLGETGWAGSGGGISSVEAEPAYQKGVVTQTTTRRANPDVAYDSDPNSGFAVYDTMNNPTSAPWYQVGGTSAASPQWAALTAIADQGRALIGLGSLDGPTQLLPKLYSLAATDFHDITSGSSTGSPSYPSGPGYDLVTGRGSPYADRVVADLVGQPASTTHFSVSAPSTVAAGASFSITVTAQDASNNTLTGYRGTVHFTSSDPSAVLPGNYTFTATDNGVHTVTVLLKAAGTQSVTVTDTANAGSTGSASIIVTPGAAASLVFGTQPSNALVNAKISPAVTVRVLDAFGNLVTSDNTDAVSLALGSNPGGATLSGGGAVTVSGGVATFGSLSLDKAGNGYTLVASSGLLPGATSSSFNITTSTGRVIEDFETSHSWHIVGGGFFGATAGYSTFMAHDGVRSLDDWDGNDWIYRNDTAAQVKAGDTISVWLQMYGAADGRAYFGFGAGSGGTLSLVAAPNTGQLIIQSNIGYGFTDLAAVPQTYQANTWYRLEVNWGASGKIVGKLYGSDGTTLINQVTATTTAIMSGGIAFRARGSDKFWDTVTLTPGVNPFTSGPIGGRRTALPAHWLAGALGMPSKEQETPAPAQPESFLHAFHTWNWMAGLPAETAGWIALR